MKIKASLVLGLWLSGLGAWLAITGCEPEKPPISAADKAAADKAAADKAAAEKASAIKAAVDKAIADKAAADKTAAEKASAIKAAADKAAADKAAAQKASAIKAAADKAAADKVAAEEKAAATSLPTDLVEFKAEITRAMAQIDMTTAKLEILAASTEDLEKPSEDALEAIEAFDKEMQNIKKRADAMRDRGAAYFEAWEKQLAAMSTPGVVEIATKRKDELAAKYAEVLTAMQESRAAYDPFWADMQAIQKAVDDGVTPENLKTLAPQIKAAKDKAAAFKGRVEVVTAKLHQVSGIYTKP